MTKTLAVLCILLVACAAPGEVAGDPGPPPASSPPSTTAGLHVIVLPGPDRRMPDGVEVGCPSGPSFPASSLDGIRPLEDDETVAGAIREFLDGEEGRFWPQEGWLVLHEGDAHAVLVHPGTGEGPAFMEVERTGGDWRWAGASAGGQCPLRTRLPEGLNAVEWRVDPDDAPGPESTEIAVLATERECASGLPMGDRLLGPEVVVTDDAVLVAFAASPLPEADQTCPGNPDQRVVVQLPEPLGNRAIRDGLSVAGRLEDYLP